MLIIIFSLQRLLVVGWRSCDRNFGALRRCNASCFFPLVVVLLCREKARSPQSIAARRRCLRPDRTHPSILPAGGGDVPTQLAQQDYVSCRYVRRHVGVGANGEATFDQGNGSSNMAVDHQVFASLYLARICTDLPITAKVLSPAFICCLPAFAGSLPELYARSEVNRNRKPVRAPGATQM